MNITVGPAGPVASDGVSTFGSEGGAIQDEFEGWLLDPLYQVRWKEPSPQVVIIKPPPPTNEKEKGKKTWIEIRLLDAEGDPMPDEEYVLYGPAGPKKGKLDGKGRVHLKNIDHGAYEVSFPDIGVVVPV